LLNAAASGNIPGVDFSTLEGYLPQIQEADMVFIVDPLGNNVGITCEDLGMSLTPPLLMGMIAPMLEEQVKMVYDAVDVLDSGTIVTVGGREFVHMGFVYHLSNVEMKANVYFCCEGTSLYGLTFTATPAASSALDMEATIQEMVESFVPGA